MMTMQDIFEHPASEALLKRLPYIPERLQAWSGRTLEDISAEFNAPAIDGAVSEIARVTLMDMVRPVLGDDIAKSFGQRLKHYPGMLAANHHGIDCFPEQIQSVHFFGLSSFLQTRQTEHNKALPCTSIIPVLACTGVSLQSGTYPRGLMTARLDNTKSGIRLPLFRSILQNTVIYKAPTLTAKDVLSMREKWNTRHMEAWRLAAADRCIHEHILCKEVLTLPTLSEQFMRINATICAERYPDYPQTTIIYLDLEELARRILLHDMNNPKSILSTLLFNKGLRGEILRKLTGKRACWTHKAAEGQSLSRTGAEGSVFFWHINAKGQRCPLAFHEGHQDSIPILRYKDFHLPLTPEAITQALQNKQIYSGLFTSFTSLHLEHGLRGYGGIYMVNYLPDMLNAVLSTLKQCAITPPPFTPFTSLASVTFTLQIQEAMSGHNVPVGGLELAAIGGLRKKDMERLGKLTIEQILPLSIQEWSLTYLPQSQQTPSLQKKFDLLNTHWRGIRYAL